jgi:hypothetical protein
MKHKLVLRWVLGAACGAAIAITAARSAAQTPEQTAVPPLRGETVKSMGQPMRWMPYVGPAIVWDRQDPASGGWELFGGFYKDLINPSIAGMGFAGEAYFRSLSGDNDGGLRAFIASPFLGLQLGYDYAFVAKEGSFVMSFSFPGRRSGPLGKGDRFRVDWYPTRNHSFSFGLNFPLFQHWKGKTRPQKDAVELAKTPKLEDPVYTPSAELKRSLDLVRETSVAINQFTVPFIDQDGETDEAHMDAFLEILADAKTYINSKDETFPNGHTWDAEVEVYHRELQNSFTMAAASGSEVGEQVTKEARRILLDEVVFPYNRLLGQRKRRDSLLGFGMRAEEVFGAWLFTSSGIEPPKHTGIMYVFRELIDYWEENRRAEKRQWEDSRLVWIPFHYVIKPDECDSQDELNAIVEKAVQTDFTRANDIHYIINELFQPELYRMIHAAEDYHVLWIHDYRGKNSAGKPDQIGYEQTVNAYIAALTERVRQYEKTRKIPVYILMLDQIYYEANDGRLWLTLLENPLEEKVNLPAGYEDWEKHIDKMQEGLRDAVEASPTLQAGRRRYGDAWLKNKIKVHVSNTNIADVSFRSNYLFQWVPFIPDVLLRDHRKISFYDITEMDPGKGEAIYTGMGVGEHYAGPTWDDRAILVSGPALVGLKDAAREVFLSQGFKETEVPVPLRTLPYPDNYDEMLEELVAKDWTATAMQVHNHPGYGMKWSNTLKATIYNLMPKGTRMLIPDSLWNSAFWAGMMIGAALRGCWVFPVAPALANAPSDGLPQMTRANEIFTRMVMVQNEMQPEIEAAGGMFRVGLFNAQHELGDAAANFRRFKEGASKSDVYRKIFPFNQSVYDLFENIENLLDTTSFAVEYLAEDVEDRKPKLHLKTQFFASREVFETLVPRPEWRPIVRAYVDARAHQVQVRDNSVDAKELRDVLSEAARPLARQWYRMTPLEIKEKTFFYLTVGSHNMDYRGKFMDGEVTVLVAETAALIAFLDFAGILAKTEWVETVDELNELLPKQGGKTRWISRFVKNAL